MAVETTTSRYEFAGNGVTVEFGFPALFHFDEDLVVITTVVLTGAETLLVLNDDYTVSGAGIPTGGSVTLLSVPPTGTAVVIYRDPPAIQELDLGDNESLPAETLETALDKVVLLCQRVSDKVARTFRMTEGYVGTFNPFIRGTPVAGSVLVVNDTQDGFDFQAGESFGGGTNSLPDFSGNPDGTLSIASDASAIEVKQHDYDGFSALTGAQFTSTSLKDTLDKIIRITYTVPTISFSASGSGTIREKGTSVSSTTLSATVTKKSNPIDEVKFYKTPSTLLDTKTGTIPTGGSESTVYGTAFTDTASFYATVKDTVVGASGGTLVTSGTVTFSYVYPYYYGAGATGKTGAQVRSDLTTYVIPSTGSVVRVIVATAGQYGYFAYPAAYSDLKTTGGVIDENGFDVTGSWTKTTLSITGLDGTSQSYKVYTTNLPFGGSVSASYTFVR